MRAIAVIFFGIQSYLNPNGAPWFSPRLISNSRAMHRPIVGRESPQEFVAVTIF